MELNQSLAQIKEFLNSEKDGKLIRIEFSNEGEIDSANDNTNIFLESSITDIETAICLLDQTPQLVFALSGKISNEFDDFATILLEFKESKTVIISSNLLTPNHQRSCNIVSTNGKMSFDLIFIFFENSKIDFLVIPSNADDESGGVMSVFFFTMKIFSPGASLTLLFLSNKIASSNFLFFASCVAKIEFR